MHFIKKFLPHGCKIETPEAKAISWRWRKTGFDYVRTRKFTLIQYGAKPIKFILKTNSGESLPSFVLSSKWSVSKSFKAYLYGTTSKPIDLKPLWRNTWNISEHSRPGAMKTRKHNSSTITATMAIGAE